MPSRTAAQNSGSFNWTDTSNVEVNPGPFQLDIYATGTAFDGSDPAAWQNGDKPSGATIQSVSETQLRLTVTNNNSGKVPVPYGLAVFNTARQQTSYLTVLFKSNPG